jgi:cysteine desulfurase
MVTYLDYAATTPCADAVVDAMAPHWANTFANAGSLHGLGLQAQQVVQAALEQLAQAFNTPAACWTYTSGATEANNTVLQSLCQQTPTPGHLIISALEHDAVRTVAYYLQDRHGWALTELPVAPQTGLIAPTHLAAAIRPDTRLISIMHGNNEVGTLQPIAELSDVARRHHIPFHTDAAQTAGKLPINLAEWPDVDYLTLSGHKCYGPKGIGALYTRHGALPLMPLLYGGGQQQGQRGGTLPVPLIVGLSAALSYALPAYQAKIPVLHQWTQQIRQAVLAANPNALWNGPLDPMQRVPGLAHFSFSGLQGEALVNQLSLKGFAVASGSACHSAQLAPSHVVLALGRSHAESMGTLRISLGLHTQPADVDKLVTVLNAVVSRLYQSKAKNK